MHYMPTVDSIFHILMHMIEYLNTAEMSDTHVHHRT